MAADLTYLVNGVDYDTDLASPFLTIETSWRLGPASPQSGW